MSWYDDDEDCPDYVSRGRKAGHPLGQGHPHIPNKAEAKELRRLMQKSGETEEQVRSKPENRRLLAAAAKSPMLPGPLGRWRIILKRACRRVATELGLQPYDPAVKEEVLRRYRMSSMYDHRYGWRWK